MSYFSILFDEVLKYRTVNAHQSAFSGYHNFINAEPVGKHPKTCALLTVIFIERLPQPRCPFTRHVDVVLTYRKKSMLSSKL